MKDLLTIENLKVAFETDQGRFRAVDDVSFSIRPGEIVGLVGESGCGKSVTALSALRLVPSPPGYIEGGKILFDGVDLLQMPLDEMRTVRGKRISMIFQEPMTALSPLHTIGKQLQETLQLHTEIGKEEAWALGLAWLRKVGIDDAKSRMHVYPHQLSGGMRQRVMIAMALMLKPDLIIADEPTTALDVTIQAQIFDLIMETKDANTAMLLITHDMGVIWEMCDRVLVMYASNIIEEGDVHSIFQSPAHPYTQGLLKAMPAFAEKQDRLYTIEGQVPSPWEYPKGCHFADRCPHAHDRCEVFPPFYPVSDQQRSACYLSDTKNDE